MKSFLIIWSRFYSLCLIKQFHIESCVTSIVWQIGIFSRLLKSTRGVRCQTGWKQIVRSVRMKEQNKRRLFPKLSALNAYVGLVVPQKYLLFFVWQTKNMKLPVCYIRKVYQNNHFCSDLNISTFVAEVSDADQKVWANISS